MSDKMEQGQKPSELKDQFAEFRRALMSYRDEGKEDVVEYLLIDPDERTIASTAASAVASRRFRTTEEQTFSGFRALKFFNPTTRATRCVLWPSFCWTHSSVRAAATKYFSGFTSVGTDYRFYFDNEAKTRFSQKYRKGIMEWMRTEETTPYFSRTIREEG